MYWIKVINNLVKELISRLYLSIVGLSGPYRSLYVSTFIIKRKVLSSDQCSELRILIDNLVKEDAETNVWIDSKGSDHRIYGLESESPSLLNALDIQQKINDIELYTGRQVKSWFLMANRVDFIDGNFGSGGGVHRDSPHSNQIKFIWYLNDVNAANGPFECAKGTNRSPITRDNIYALGETRFEGFGGLPVSTLTGGEGDMIIFDTKSLHRGKPIKEGARYAITLYTSPKHDALRKHLALLGIGDVLNVDNQI